MVKLLHPKLRRLLQQRLLKDGQEADKRKAQKQAQKAVERERVQTALSQLSESLVTSSRAQILAQLQPGVQGKQRKGAKKTLRKAVSCSVLQTRSLG